MTKAFLFIGFLLIGKAMAEPKVVLHLLGDRVKTKGANQFWNAFDKSWNKISETKNITGDEATALLDMLDKTLSNRESMNLCGHSPIYGIVATNAEGKTLKTSLYFSCSTWLRGVNRLNIRGPRGIDGKLCQLLRSHIELPEEVLAADAARKREQAKRQAQEAAAETK